MIKTYSAKIVAFTIQYAQRGTCINAVLSIPTRRQSTNEEVNVEFSYSTKNLLLVLWKFRKDAKEFGRSIQKHEGEHNLDPTDFTRGLLWT